MSTAEVVIVSTLLTDRKEGGNLSIEFVSTKNAESVKKERQKGMIKKNRYIWQQKSQVLQLPLDNNEECVVKFSIKGGLNPAEDMNDGENSIVYRERDQSSARKFLRLNPSTESDNTDIRFTVDGIFLHSVSIVNGQCQTETVSEELAALNVNVASSAVLRDIKESTIEASISASTSGGKTSYQAENLATPELPLSGVTPMSPDPSDVEECAMGASSTATTSGDNTRAANLATPKFPLSGVTPVAADSSDVGECTMQASSTATTSVGRGFGIREGSSYEADESDYKTLLSDKSLKVLATVIRPNDINALLIQLEVNQATLDQEKINHRGDIVSVYYQCLLHWRGAGLKEGSAKGVYKGLFDALIIELNEINRKDIKLVLENILREGSRNLRQSDFL